VIINARLDRNKWSDRRSSPRRKISLDVGLDASGRGVTIHDVSASGMLIETAAKLPLLEAIQIDLPEALGRHAVVVWNSGRYYGCEFREPLSKAAISAALLRSRPTRDAATGERAPAQVLQPGPAEAKTLQVDPPATGLEQEKAPLRVRLRVILGSAILLWALIALAVRALVAMIW